MKTKEKRNKGVIIAGLIFFIVCILPIVFHRSILTKVFQYLEGEKIVDSELGYFNLSHELLSYELKQTTSLELEPVSSDELNQIKTKQYVPLNRTTEEYLGIAKVINKQLWGEPFELWNISSISSRWKCEDIDEGMYQLSFQFFRDAIVDEKKVRLESEISFLPELDAVSWAKQIYEPQLSSWSSIEFEQVMTPEQILMIVEKEGGEVARISVENQCAIRAYILKKKWNIYYHRNDQNGGFENIFEVMVDSISGKVSK